MKKEEVLKAADEIYEKLKDLTGHEGIAVLDVVKSLFEARGY